MHHKMQPHHHVTAWAVCALVLVLVAVLSTNTARTVAENKNDGPSNSTKQFFGAEDEDKEDRYDSPKECARPDENNQSRQERPQDQPPEGQSSQGQPPEGRSSQGQ